jgi:type I restriction enzyme M protein
MSQAMNTNNDVVQKLWSLCNVLRDDGMVYHQYMTELTYLLFLKLAAENGTEGALPQQYRWHSLATRYGEEQLSFYRKMLTHLGEDAENRVVREIFSFPTTVFKHAANLRMTIEGINSLDWQSSRGNGFGDIYEGLLEKNAVESKSGAGQYFTPRVLIDCIISLIQPQAGEIIQDPAAGTGGFLISAARHIQKHGSRDENLETVYQGVELVQDTYRLCLMNLVVHGLGGGDLIHGDALSDDYRRLHAADVIVTNPPFGTKRGGGQPVRSDLPFPTSNKQLAFLQHIYQGLKPGGRGAVVLPDNVLFEEGVGSRIRTDLMEKCNLHTILRLPTGIFYAQGVKTNVLFFTRGHQPSRNTSAVWIYDLRTNMPSFGKRTPLSQQHFKDFERAYGDDPHGNSPREDQGPGGRFRCFSRDDIQRRGDNLDLIWLRDADLGKDDDLPDPEIIAAKIASQLQLALTNIEELTAMLMAAEEAT